MFYAKGIHSIQRSAIDSIKDHYVGKNTAFFTLQGLDIQDERSWYETLRAALPAEPELYLANLSWDATFDSISSGLMGLNVDHVVILCRNYRPLEESHPAIYKAAIDLFKSLVEDLCDPELTVGQPKDVYVFLIEE